MYRVLGLALCALAGWLSLRFHSLAWLSIAMGMAYVLTLPLRKAPKHFEAVPKREKGHV
jgi:hypothetical protein